MATTSRVNQLQDQFPGFAGEAAAGAVDLGQVDGGRTA